MEEPRRIELMSAHTMGKAKKAEKSKPANRFDLTLAESTGKTCPEFSFIDLIRNASKKEDENGSGDPFGDADDEEDAKLRALAASFEQKYGAAAAAAKKKPGRKTQNIDNIDLFDLGDGYDANDPFVDDSEAYDELVPETLTTKLGGFYINSGVLDFKVISGDSDDDFIVTGKKKSKKNLITSDSESDRDSGNKSEKDPPKKMKKSKFLAEVEEKIRKRKKFSSSSFDGEKPMKKKSKIVNNVAEKKLIKKKLSVAANSNVLSSPSANSQINGDLKSTPKPVNNGQELDNLTDSTDRPASEDDGEKVKVSPENAPPLPVNLPTSLLEDIDRMKKAAKVTAEGKCKFFSGSVNDILLSIEVASRQLACSQRVNIYAHLAAFLPCSQQTLTKRAKNLRLNGPDDKLLLRDPLQKLKDALSRVMQGQIQRHHQDCQAAQLAWQEGNSKVEMEPQSADSNDEGEKKDGEKKRFRMPNKKFEWTDEIRKLVCDVVRVKMKTYDSMKNKTQSADDYLMAFLEAEVKNLWPKGWMQSRMLFKETKGIHAQWTLSLKTKKALITTKPALQAPAKPPEAVKVTSPSVSEQRKSLLTPDMIKDRHVSPGSGSRSPFTSPGSSNHSPPSQKPVPTILDYAGINYASQPKAKVATCANKSSTSEDRSFNNIINETLALSRGSFVEPNVTVAVSNVTGKTSIDSESVSGALNLSQPNTSSSQRKRDNMENDDFFTMFEQFVRKDLGAEKDLLSPSKELQAEKDKNTSIKRQPDNVPTSKPSSYYDKVLGTTDVSKALKAALFDKASEKSFTSLSETVEKTHKTNIASGDIVKTSVTNVSNVSSALNLSTSLPKTNSKSSSSGISKEGGIPFSKGIMSPGILPSAKTTGTIDFFAPFLTQHNTSESKSSHSGSKTSKTPTHKSNVKSTPTVNSSKQVVSQNPSLTQWPASAGISKHSEHKTATKVGNVKLGAPLGHLSDNKSQNSLPLPLPRSSSSQQAGSVSKSHSADNVKKSISSQQRYLPGFAGNILPTAKTVSGASFSAESNIEPSLSKRSPVDSYSAMKAPLDTYVTKKPEAKKTFEGPASVKHKSVSPLALNRPAQSSSSQQQHPSSSSHSMVKPVAQRHPVSPKLNSGSSPPMRTSNTSPSRIRQSSPQSLFVGTQALQQYQMLAKGSLAYQQQLLAQGVGSKSPSGTSTWPLAGVTTPTSPTADILANSFSTPSPLGVPPTSSALSLPGYSRLSLSDLARESPVYGTSPYSSAEAALSQLYGRSPASLVPPSLPNQGQIRPPNTQNVSQQHRF